VSDVRDDDLRRRGVLLHDRAMGSRKPPRDRPDGRPNAEIGVSNQDSRISQGSQNWCAPRPRPVSTIRTIEDQLRSTEVDRISQEIANYQLDM